MINCVSSFPTFTHELAAEIYLTMLLRQEPEEEALRTAILLDALLEPEIQALLKDNNE